MEDLIKKKGIRELLSSISRIAKEEDFLKKKDTKKQTSHFADNEVSLRHASFIMKEVLEIELPLFWLKKYPPKQYEKALR